VTGVQTCALPILPRPDAHLLPAPEQQPRAEAAAIALLFVAALCATAFPVIYFVFAGIAETK